MIKGDHGAAPGPVRHHLARALTQTAGIVLDGVHLTKKDLQQINRVYMVACGSAYHTCMVGKYIMEKACPHTGGSGSGVGVPLP